MRAFHLGVRKDISGVGGGGKKKSSDGTEMGAPTARRECPVNWKEAWEAPKRKRVVWCGSGTSDASALRASRRSIVQRGARSLLRRP